MQKAYIKADNNNAGDQFGYSLSVSSGNIVVGANAESSNQTTITSNGSTDNSNNASGAVYLFK